jgi:RimJ/RimL family protein N-acetyltransferase
VNRPVESVPLIGHDVRLEPLNESHLPGLVVAAGGDRSTFGLTMVPEPNEESVGDYVRSAMAAQLSGSALPYATVRAADGVVVGSTRFLNIEFWGWPFGRPSDAAAQARTTPEAVEIGGTWLNANAQRTSINTEAKLLMLTHAFETWQVLRLCLKTDERNARSRANIERIGATFEGVLRNHMYAADSTGTGIRHSAFYSITLDESPMVKSGLTARIAAYAKRA